MLTSETIAHLWRLWVDMVGGLGLPMDRQGAAILALAVIFYGIGVAFKKLVSRE